MKTGWSLVCMSVLTAVTGVAVARADITGSYDGTVSGASPAAAAAVLTLAGKFVTGTIAIGTEANSAYIVSGKATAKRVTVKGTSPGGVKLKWVGKIAGASIQGKVKLKGVGKPTVGVLALTQNASTGDGSGCDAVYTANMQTFDDDILGHVLTPCLACHVSGGQAASTRLHLDLTNKLASARSVALQIDSTTPSASRILGKPTGTLPHGGEQQITAGSAEETSLVNWVNLVAAAHCN